MPVVETWVAPFVIGVAVLAVGAVLLSRDGRFVRSLHRRVGDAPFAVTVQSDPRLMPRLDYFPPTLFFFASPSTPDELPPDDLLDWWAWAHAHGGVDAGETQLSALIQSVQDEVILDRIEVSDVRGQRGEGVLRSPGGIGGVDIELRWVTVVLGEAAPVIQEHDADQTRPFRAKVVTPGDPEQLLFRVFTVDDCLHEYFIELVFVHEGHEWRHSLSGAVPLTTVGSAGLGGYWTEDGRAWH